MLIAFVAITLIAAAALLVARDALTSRSRAIDQRMTDGGQDIGLQRFPADVDLDSRAGMIRRFDNWFTRLVVETGLSMVPITAFLMVVAAGLAVGGSLYVWRQDPLPSLMGGALAVLAMYVFFLVRRARRRRQIQEQLPDVAELLSRSVRAGESLDQAIEWVGQTADDPLGTEFRRCARHLHMGLSMDATMRALTRRAPLSETRILAATFIVQRQTGGTLPVVLDRLAKVFRDRLNYERQFRASTAAGRLSVIIISLAAPVVAAYMFVFRPDYLRTFAELPFGMGLLVAAISLQLIGLLWVITLLRSDY